MPDKTPGNDERQPGSKTYLRHFGDSRESFAAPAHPWRLALLTLGCAVLVVVGSIGPWMDMEGISNAEVVIRTMEGWRTDGVFTIPLGTIAILAAGTMLVRPGARLSAWVATGALLVCAIIGLADWLLFAPSTPLVDNFSRIRIVEFRWGVKLVFLAGLVGAISGVIAARRLADD